MTKQIGMLVFIAAGVGAAIWLRNAALAHASAADAHGVTGTTKDAGISTTPVQSSNVAIVALANPLDHLKAFGTRIAAAVGDSLQSNSLTDWRVPFGNPLSAEAGTSSKNNTNVSNYRPSAWAPISFNAGVT